MNSTRSDHKVVHPHDEIIRAWLDGETIEVQNSSGSSWYPVGTVSERGSVPTFNKSLTYRIKPKTTAVTHKYRRFCWRSSLDQSLGIGTCECPKDPTMVSYTLKSISTSSMFIKWIDDDWVTETYEVEIPA